MRGFRALCACLLLASAGLFGQSSLDQAIAAKFPLTKATADLNDIVTAGSVMTLKKDHVIMFGTGVAGRSQLIYRDGKVQPTVMTRMAAFSITGRPATNITQRTYVAGEKLWLINIEGQTDGVVLQLLSDPVGDVRYTTFLKFPFAKGSTPNQDQLIAQIGEVLAPDGGGAAAPAPPPSSAALQPLTPPPSAPAPTPAAALAPIAPPPPPADQAAVPPATLEKGQSRDAVIAGFGQPTRVVKMGAKEIDFYKDMKVTYLNGKVSNVE